MVKKYRKRPVVIEAIQLDGDDPKPVCDFAGLEDHYSPGEVCNSLIIPTMEGDMKAMPGDYIIKGINGEFYPCKPDIFEKTYDLVGRVS